MTKKTNSKSKINSKLSGKLSNLNRNSKKSRRSSRHIRKYIPNNLDPVNVDPVADSRIHVPLLEPFPPLEDAIELARSKPLVPLPGPLDPGRIDPRTLNPTFLGPTPLKVYKGKTKKVFVRNSWPNPRIAYITSTSQQMQDARITQEHLKEELLYTKLLHGIFPFILDAEDITANNEERVKEGAEINQNSSTLSRIFVYKKERVLHATGTTPGILKFMIDCIYTMANPELAFENDEAEYFTYLDMKPDNIGVKPDGTFVLLDNGPDLCYVIPKEFISYFQEAAIIVGVIRLKRRLTDEELDHLRTLGLTPQLVIATLHRRIYKKDERQIIQHAVKYYEDHGLPLTAESMPTDLMLPREVLNHYCDIDESDGIESRRDRIRVIMNFTRLAEL